MRVNRDTFLHGVDVLVPVFALPNLVFFPKTLLPLHVFEPRYLDMVEDALPAENLIAMAHLKEGWEADYYGNPPAYEIGTLGVLRRVDRLPNGRFNILLLGLGRYRIREEVGGKPYRRAIIESPPSDEDPLQVLPRDLRSRLSERLCQYRSLVGGASAGKTPAPADNGDDAAFVNVLCSTLDFSPVEKQFLLEADGLRSRSARLADLLRFRIGDIEGGRVSERRTEDP